MERFMIKSILCFLVLGTGLLFFSSFAFAEQGTQSLQDPRAQKIMEDFCQKFPDDPHCTMVQQEEGTAQGERSQEATPTASTDLKTREGVTQDPKRDLPQSGIAIQDLVCPEGQSPQKRLAVAYESANRLSLFDESGNFIEDLATDMTGPSGVVVSGPYLIVTNDDHQVVRFDLRTRERDILGDKFGNPNGVAGMRFGEDPRLFVTDAQTAKLYQCSSLELGSCQEMNVTFRKPLDVPQGVAFDGRFLYVGDFQNLYKIDLSQDNKVAEPVFPDNTFVGSQGGYAYSEVLQKIIAPQYDRSFWMVDEKGAGRFSVDVEGFQSRGSAMKPDDTAEVYIGDYQDGSVLSCRFDLFQFSCRYFIEDHTQGMGTTGLAWVKLCAEPSSEVVSREKEKDDSVQEDPKSETLPEPKIFEEPDVPNDQDRPKESEDEFEIPVMEDEKIFFSGTKEDVVEDNAPFQEKTSELVPQVDHSAIVSSEPEEEFSTDSPVGGWALTGGGSCGSNLDPYAKPTRTGTVFCLFMLVYLLVVLKQRRRLV